METPEMSWIDICYGVLGAAMVGGASWLVLRWMFEQNWSRQEDD